jgi:metallo-beta-lactamase class B
MSMRKRSRAMILAALASGIGAAGYAEHAVARAGAVLAIYDTQAIHVASAARIAGKDLVSVARLCVPHEGPAPAANTAQPSKIFDNLYFIGIPGVSSWAITTSEGIIVIDSLDNPREAQTFIEGGLRKLGLDPNQVKYVIITHAHTDHFGGAQYLADKLHAQLVMSETDWGTLSRLAPPTNPDRGPIPKRGTGVPDGFKLTLGDTTVEIVQTPPHTPGAISLIFPVRDGNQRHMAGLWGGIGFNFQQTEANYTTYFNSVEKYAKIAQARGVDVPIANHSNFDNAFEKIAALKTRQAGQPHPFVLGAGAQQRIFDIQEECAMAGRAKVRTAAAGAPAAAAAP